MDFELINLIGMAVAAGLFYQSIRLVRKGKESVIEFLMWSSFGIGLFMISISSGINLVGALDAITIGMELLGFSSGVNGIFVLAILGLLLLLFYTYTNVKTNQKEMQRLNQELAVLRFEHEDSQSETTHPQSQNGPDPHDDPA